MADSADSARGQRADRERSIGTDTRGRKAGAGASDDSPGTPGSDASSRSELPAIAGLNGAAARFLTALDDVNDTVKRQFVGKNSLLAKAEAAASRLLDSENSGEVMKGLTEARKLLEFTDTQRHRLHLLGLEATDRALKHVERVNGVDGSPDMGDSWSRAREELKADVDKPPKKR